MAAGTIAKPQLRRLLEARIKVALIGASIASVLSGIAYKYGITEPRKKAYEEFYKTYDPEKRIKLMCKYGLLQSCSPDKY